MSTEDLEHKLNAHRKSTEQLHAALRDHVKGDSAKLAKVERLTKEHTGTTDQFVHDAQVLVRPTGQPVH